MLAAVAGNVEIGADALCRLRVDRQGFAPAARRDPKGEDPLTPYQGNPFRWVCPTPP
jgi:hypothetical protein